MRYWGPVSILFTFHLQPPRRVTRNFLGWLRQWREYTFSVIPVLISCRDFWNLIPFYFLFPFAFLKHVLIAFAFSVVNLMAWRLLWSYWTSESHLSVHRPICLSILVSFLACNNMSTYVIQLEGREFLDVLTVKLLWHNCLTTGFASNFVAICLPVNESRAAWELEFSTRWKTQKPNNAWVIIHHHWFAFAEVTLVDQGARPWYLRRLCWHFSFWKQKKSVIARWNSTRQSNQRKADTTNKEMKK